MVRQRNGDDSDCAGSRTTMEAGRHMAEWLYDWDWRWWITLTFSRDLGQGKANNILSEYLNEYEKAYRDSLTCVIAQEQKSISGSGKSAGRVHFHMLVGSAVDYGPQALQDLWQQPRFGGNGTSGAGADVRPYDPQRGAITYLLKAQTEQTSGPSSATWSCSALYSDQRSYVLEDAAEIAARHGAAGALELQAKRGWVLGASMSRVRRLLLAGRVLRVPFIRAVARCGN